jgi:hypothetical protein
VLTLWDERIFYVHGIGRGLSVLGDHFLDGKLVLESCVHATLVGMLKCRYFVAARKGKGDGSDVCVDTINGEIKVLLCLDLGSALEAIGLWLRDQILVDLKPQVIISRSAMQCKAEYRAVSIGLGSGIVIANKMKIVV